MQGWKGDGWTLEVGDGDGGVTRTMEVMVCRGGGGGVVVSRTIMVVRGGCCWGLVEVEGGWDVLDEDVAGAGIKGLGVGGEVLVSLVGVVDEGGFRLATRMEDESCEPPSETRLILELPAVAVLLGVWTLVVEAVVGSDCKHASNDDTASLLFFGRLAQVVPVLKSKSLKIASGPRFLEYALLTM